MSLKEWLINYWGDSKPMWPSWKNCQPTLVVRSFQEPAVYQSSLGPLFENLPFRNSFDPIMAPGFRLRFCIENLNRRTSSYNAVSQDVSREQYFHDLHKAAATGNETLYGVITSEIEGQSVLTLDCDGTDEMLSVCHVLKSYYKLNYAVVISSPNHYWVIADKVGTPTELLAMMEIMPGIDSRYVDCIRNKYLIVLRGFPKDSIPIFPDEDEFTDDRAGRWYAEFKKAWQSEEMKHVLRLKQLFKAIKEKKVADLAASPSFAI